MFYHKVIIVEYFIHTYMLANHSRGQPSLTFQWLQHLGVEEGATPFSGLLLLPLIYTL